MNLHLRRLDFCVFYPSVPNFPFFIVCTSPNLAPPWSMLSTISAASFLETLPAYLFFVAPLSVSQMPYAEHAFLSVEHPAFARHLEKTQPLPLHCVCYWTNCTRDISSFLVFFTPRTSTWMCVTPLKFLRAVTHQPPGWSPWFTGILTEFL